MEEEKEPIEDCPNCGAIWAVGTQEYDWQICSCCGYSDYAEGYVKEEDDEEDDEEDYEDYFD